MVNVHVKHQQRVLKAFSPVQEEKKHEINFEIRNDSTHIDRIETTRISVSTNCRRDLQAKNWWIWPNDHTTQGFKKRIKDSQTFGLGHRRIIVSTIGILPGIDRLTKEFPQVNLTFSLHSPFDEQRSELMPINNRFPLYDVLNKLDQHIRDTGRKVYIAYILLRGENDSNELRKPLLLC